MRVLNMGNNMKILIISSVFYPSVGGMETFAATLAEELVRKQQFVKLVSYTSITQELETSYSIYRNPSYQELFKLFKWADKVINNGILSNQLPLYCLFRKKQFIVHHTWFPPTFIGNLKKEITLFFQNIAVSRAIAEKIKGKTTVIHNPLARKFLKAKLIPIINESRNLHLVYLGRLVSDKGVLDILDYIKKINEEGRKIKLSIIGEGPERSNLETFCKDFQLSGVEFLGKKNQEELIGLLPKFEIMVIPSRWEEPFGIIALEGMAMNNVVIATEKGGLPEAIGNSSFLFRDYSSFKKLILKLENPTERELRLKSQYEHLKKFDPKVIVNQYLACLNNN